MQDIIIVCAGSVATEVYTVIRQINKCEVEKGRPERYHILGFLSDIPDSLDKYPYIKLPILGDITNWKPIGNEKYVLANATPKSKVKIVELLKRRGCIFETLIAPNTFIGENVEIGEGCFITAFSIGAGIKIGDFVNIMGSMIGGSAEIGDYSTTLGFTNVAGGKLGKRVYVGSHAVILDVSVGDDAFVAVGSIVIRNVKSGVKVFGNPAKRVDW